MVAAIQIIGVLFGGAMLYFSFLSVKRKEFTTIEWFFWTLFSIAFIIISIYPNLLDNIARAARVGRTIDLLIILGFIFIIAAIFYTYTITRHNQKQVEEVVRQIAIRKK